jgi:hypothetical protein
MSVVLPQSIASTAGWQLVDWRTESLRTDPAAGGLATATADQLESDQLWLITRAVCFCTSAGQTSLRLYASTVSPGFLLDGSERGNFDVAEYPAGLQLHGGQQLVAQWSNAAAGSVGTVNVQYSLYQRTG